MKQELENIFQRAWDSLTFYHALMMGKKAIIAFSGGKDSALVLQFYLWLKQKALISKSPILYHLDHSIRNNSEQETSILEYAESLNLELFFKKKTSHSSAIKPA
ncbi:ATP-binding protein [Leptospira wolffii]|uniref:ATP-binding protein n=1 Tax=Leptospira wolffii TaxID=409998 RepID=UPI0003540A05|nr:ATP-binding protein [Leptospira wolffii]EPG65428.1 PP-loop domain protein [Leptospira wolffii serovar Khorat str. Khorat-H2]